MSDHRNFCPIWGTDARHAIQPGNRNAGCLCPTDVVVRSHDPLCEIARFDCVQGDQHALEKWHPLLGHMTCDCSCACDCDRIAEVRADEREQAAQRVASVPLLGNMGDPWYSNAVAITKAIAAARGETS